MIYTRHAHVPDLQNPQAPFPRMRRGWRTRLGDRAELRPNPGEMVIEKTTCSAFVSGELDRVLRQREIRHLAFCGNTIDVCVHSTLRAAVDLDYECLLLGDCCATVSDGLHAWAIESVKVEDGVFGTVANAEAFLHAFSR